MNENEIGDTIIDAAMALHKELGPLRQAPFDFAQDGQDRLDYLKRSMR